MAIGSVHDIPIGRVGIPHLLGLRQMEPARVHLPKRTHIGHGDKQVKVALDTAVPAQVAATRRKGARVLNTVRTLGKRGEQLREHSLVDAREHIKRGQHIDRQSLKPRKEPAGILHQTTDLK